MTDTSRTTPDWQTLTAEQKRERVLEVAGELFAREGTEFPMPELAKAVGAGVGSLYRQVGKKDDVIAELVITRLDSLAERYAEAAAKPDAMAALRTVMRDVIDECIEDRVLRHCWDFQLGHEPCDAARDRARTQLAGLIKQATGPGGLRDDVTPNDLRSIFRSAPSAELIAPGAAQRLGEIALDGLTRRD